MTNRTDLDLDVVSFVKELSTKNAHAKKPIDEAVFYLRKNEGKVFVTFYGDDVSLVNSFITVMDKQDGMYDILSSALELYENESVCVYTEE